MVFSAALVRERRTMEDPCAPGFFSFKASTPTIAFLAALLVARAEGTEFLAAVVNLALLLVVLVARGREFLAAVGVALALLAEMRAGGREFLKDLLAFPLMAVTLVAGGRDFRDNDATLALLVGMAGAPDIRDFAGVVVDLVTADPVFIPGPAPLAAGPAARSCKPAGTERGTL
jgi:hypothetical protein